VCLSFRVGPKETFSIDKKTGIILHQKTAHLQNALSYNILGLPSKTLGKNILIEGKQQLTNVYPTVSQIENEKVISIASFSEVYKIVTNKGVCTSEIVTIALNYSKTFTIISLESFRKPHKKANPEKDRIQLINN
jgi:thioredoxin reductase